MAERSSQLIRSRLSDSLTLCLLVSSSAPSASPASLLSLCLLWEVLSELQVRAIRVVVLPKVWQPNKLSTRVIGSR